MVRGVILSFLTFFLASCEAAPARYLREPVCDTVLPLGQEGQFAAWLGDHSVGANAGDYPTVVDQVVAVLESRAFPKPARSKLLLAARAASQPEDAINAMLAAAGWGQLLSAQQARELDAVAAARNRPTDEPGYVGLKVDRWPIVEVVPQSPAEDAGLQGGDVVLQVGKVAASAAANPEQARKLLAGPAGEEVEITVRRGPASLTREVKRSSGGAMGVRYRVLPGEALYIHIPTFEGSGIADRVLAAIKKNANPRLLVLDVRDNPGGRPEEADAVAGALLDKRLLQIMLFASGKRVGIESAGGGNTTTPLAVLVNRNTGSAAEVLAMSLRDNGRARLYGEPTTGALFGKDLEKLRDGRTIIFRSEPTILSPLGIDYSHKGLSPDVRVLDSRVTSKDAILEAALKAAP